MYSDDGNDCLMKQIVMTLNDCLMKQIYLERFKQKNMTIEVAVIH